jgi:hypothetical protein
MAMVNRAIAVWATSLVLSDYCDPTPVRIDSSRPDDEIFTDCEVTLRSEDLVSLLCGTAWNATVLGVHPDGRRDPAIFRISDGSRLTLREVVADAAETDLRTRIRALLASEWREETAGYADDRLDELADALLHSAYLKDQRLTFAIWRYPQYFEVSIPADEAVRFVTPAIQKALKRAR